MIFFCFQFSFDKCLSNLDLVLQHCEETKLVLNWKKCHFIVQERIVLGHEISQKRIEVDKVKVEIIEKLPPPFNAKVVRSFLRYAKLYYHFIRIFPKSLNLE